MSFQVADTALQASFEDIDRLEKILHKSSGGRWLIPVLPIFRYFSLIWNKKKTLDATLPAILNILGEVLYIRFWKFAIQFFKIRTKEVNHDAVRWLKKTKSGILECCRSKSILHSHFSWNVSRIAAVSLNAPSSWEYKTTAGLFLSELRLSFKALWWFLSEIRPSTGRDWVRFELGGLSKICYKPATIRALLMSNPGPWLTKWFHSLQSLER